MITVKRFSQTREETIRVVAHFVYGEICLAILAGGTLGDILIIDAPCKLLTAVAYSSDYVSIVKGS